MLNQDNHPQKRDMPYQKAPRPTEEVRDGHLYVDGMDVGVAVSPWATNNFWFMFASTADPTSLVGRVGPQRRNELGALWSQFESECLELLIQVREAVRKYEGINRLSYMTAEKALIWEDANRLLLAAADALVARGANRGDLYG